MNKNKQTSDRISYLNLVIGRNFIYLILALSCIVRIYYVFSYPIREDELSHLRYASNLTLGFIPGVHFYEVYFPLFNVLLSPFILLFKYNINIVFYVRIFMLLYLHFALFFYHKLLIKYFNRFVANIAVFLFVSSLICFMESMEIRQFHFSFPTFILLLYYVVNSSNITKLKDVIIAFVLFLIVSIDHRSFLYVAMFLWFYNSYKIKDRKIVVFIFSALVCGILSIILFIDHRMIFSILNVARVSAGKNELIQPYNLKLLLTDIHFFTFFVVCSGNLLFYKRLKKNIFGNKIFWLVIILVIFFSKRADAIYIYLLPFLSIKLAEFYSLNIRKIKLFRAMDYFFAALLLINLIVQAEIKKRSFNDLLNKEKIMMEKINKKVIDGFAVLNLSRYQFDIFGSLISPYPIQVEEDVTGSLKKISLYSYFNDQVFKLLNDRKYYYIIFNENDNFVNRPIKNFIQKNYKKIDTYLYEINESHVAASGNIQIFNADNIDKCNTLLNKLTEDRIL